jgi:hypothetical protein
MIECKANKCTVDVERDFYLIPKRKNVYHMVCKFHYEDYKERNKDAELD